MATREVDEGYDEEELDEAAYPARDAPESLGEFGRVEDTSDMDSEPIPFTVVGYERRATLNEETGKMEHRERRWTFHVYADMSFGPMLNVLNGVDAKGQVAVPQAVQFIGDCLIAEDQKLFWEAMREPGIKIHAELIKDVAEALAVRYGLRPSMSRSERRHGLRRTGRTTAAGRAVRGSR